MADQANDKKHEQDEIQNKYHQDALKAREENAKEDNDPFGDLDNLNRSFPNRVDQSGTPDTQPHQPAEALGEGQVSIDSTKKEAKELQEQAEKHATRSEKRQGVAQVSKEDQAKAEAKAKS